MNPFAWTVILLLIAVNAFYVAAEFAAVGVRRGPVRQLAKDGHRLAKGLLPILEDTHLLDRYIAACQIGITLSSLVLGAFGQATLTLDFARLLQGWTGMGETAAISTMATVVLVVLTAVQVVFGELVPKSLALQYPTQVALWTYLPMRWSLAFYSWFIFVMNGSGLFLVKLLGFPPGAGHRHIHSPEEIEMLVAESSDGGLLEPEEKERLRRALRLGRRTARELMVPRRLVRMIDADLPTRDIVRIVTTSQYTRLPVYRGSVDDIIGFLHTRDLAACIAEERPIVVEELLKPLHAVPSLLEVERLLPALRQRGRRMALVLDEFGGVEGIVTLQDLMAELIGDVADQYGTLETRPERAADGRLRLPGSLRLDEVSGLTGVEWRSPDVTTLGGYIIAQIGRIPNTGENVTIDGLAITIERVENHAIAVVLIPAGTSADPASDHPRPDGANLS